MAATLRSFTAHIKDFQLQTGRAARCVAKKGADKKRCAAYARRAQSARDKAVKAATALKAKGKAPISSIDAGLKALGISTARASSGGTTLFRPGSSGDVMTAEAADPGVSEFQEATAGDYGESSGSMVVPLLGLLAVAVVGGVAYKVMT